MAHELPSSLVEERRFEVVGLSGSAPSSAPELEEEDEPDAPLVDPEEDEVVPELAPPSGGLELVAPLIVIVRLVKATLSSYCVLPLAAMPAIHSVIGPFLFGATNEKRYVPGLPGGGLTAATSPGASTGNGTSVFVPFVAVTPSLSAALNDVLGRPSPVTTTVTSPFSPAFNALGAVMSSVGASPDGVWQLVQVTTWPLYGLPL
jgi:hypothetical protein